MKSTVLKKLELLIPPPLLALVWALLMWKLAPFVPHPAQLPIYHLLISSAAAIAGVGSAVLGLICFIRHKTTLNPHKPWNVSVLVRNGIYRYTRNPMYVGLLLVLAGWALYLTHLFPLLLLPLFVVYLNRFQIEPEEKVLEERFGTDFTSYRDTVRRWL